MSCDHTDTVCDMRQEVDRHMRQEVDRHMRQEVDRHVESVTSCDEDDG